MPSRHYNNPHVNQLYEWALNNHCILTKLKQDFHYVVDLLENIDKATKETLILKQNDPYDLDNLLSEELSTLFKKIDETTDNNDSTPEQTDFSEYIIKITPEEKEAYQRVERAALSRDLANALNEYQDSNNVCLDVSPQSFESFINDTFKHIQEHGYDLNYDYNVPKAIAEHISLGKWDCVHLDETSLVKTWKIFCETERNGSVVDSLTDMPHFGETFHSFDAATYALNEDCVHYINSHLSQLYDTGCDHVYAYIEDYIFDKNGNDISQGDSYVVCFDWYKPSKGYSVSTSQSYKQGNL